MALGAPRQFQGRAARCFHFQILRHGRQGRTGSRQGHMVETYGIALRAAATAADPYSGQTIRRERDVRRPNLVPDRSVIGNVCFKLIALAHQFEPKRHPCVVASVYPSATVGRTSPNEMGLPRSGIAYPQHDFLGRCRSVLPYHKPEFLFVSELFARKHPGH